MRLHAGTYMQGTEGGHGAPVAVPAVLLLSNQASKKAAAGARGGGQCLAYQRASTCAMSVQPILFIA